MKEVPTTSRHHEDSYSPDHPTCIDRCFEWNIDCCCKWNIAGCCEWNIAGCCERNIACCCEAKRWKGETSETSSRPYLDCQQQYLYTHSVNILRILWASRIRGPHSYPGNLRWASVVLPCKAPSCVITLVSSTVCCPLSFSLWVDSDKYVFLLVSSQLEHLSNCSILRSCNYLPFHIVSLLCVWVLFGATIASDHRAIWRRLLNLLHWVTKGQFLKCTRTILSLNLPQFWNHFLP
jgi:hypothetical protein